jgi:hypothetical protein
VRFNSDARLRGLERRWRESGTIEDHAFYIRELMRVGQADPAKLWILARMGAPEREAIVTAFDEMIPEARFWIHGGPQVEQHALGFGTLLNEDIEVYLTDVRPGDQIVPRLPPHRLVTRLLAFAELFRALDRLWNSWGPDHEWDNIGEIPGFRAKELDSVAELYSRDPAVSVRAVQALKEWADTLRDSFETALYWFDARERLPGMDEGFVSSVIFGYMRASLAAWLRSQPPPPVLDPGQIARAEQFRQALELTGQDEEAADMVVKLMHGEADPYAVDGVDQRARQLHSMPTRSWATIQALDILIDGFGVEGVVTPGGRRASYINTGDTYNPTIMWEHPGDFFISTYGDWVATHEDDEEDEGEWEVEENPRRRRNRPGEWKDPPPCAPAAAAKRLKHAVQLRQLVGQKVRVHVNLHNGCYTISSRGRVAGYTKSLKLKDVTPRVSLSGWESCNVTKVRNVHAYLEGTLVSASAKKPRGKAWKKITYRCKEHGPCFYYPSTDKTFAGASEVVFLNKGGRGFAQIEVLAKGAPTKKNPPPCSCRFPGGACACGCVQAWWVEPPPQCEVCP